MLVRKEFFKLLDRHIPKGSPLYRIFNRNTVKLSYSCMETMKSMINIHNKQILKSPEPSEERKCNCPKTKPNCPLDGHCLIKNIVYKATVTSDASSPKQYIGLTSRTFKERLGSHTQSFKNKDLSHSTELSKYLWSLQDRNEKYSIKWSIVQQATPTTQPPNAAICAWPRNITS